MIATQECLIAIVGPTAVGKSTLAMRLAKQFDIEIINADSRQVYQHMDIGTSKPSPNDQTNVTHHLIDIIDPDESYSLAHFLRQASEAIQDVHQRSKLPVIVGGTGQYVWGLLEGWRVPEIPPNLDLRRQLEKQARLEGPNALYHKLSELDPKTAHRSDPQNTRRIIRALEVYYASPKRPSKPPQKTPPSYQTMILGLTLERSDLYRRIDERVENMVESGWVDEVKGLLKMGYGPELPSLTSLGYRELVQYLNVDLSMNVALDIIKNKIHKFARGQYNWFRLNDERIKWYNVSEGFDQIEIDIAHWLELQKPALRGNNRQN